MRPVQIGESSNDVLTDNAGGMRLPAPLNYALLALVSGCGAPSEVWTGP